MVVVLLKEFLSYCWQSDFCSAERVVWALLKEWFGHCWESGCGTAERVFVALLTEWLWLCWKSGLGTVDRVVVALLTEWLWYCWKRSCCTAEREVVALLTEWLLLTPEDTVGAYWWAIMLEEKLKYRKREQECLFKFIVFSDMYNLSKILFQKLPIDTDWNCRSMTCWQFLRRFKKCWN